jgi:toxin YhaV
MNVGGWTVLFHGGVLAQLRTLTDAYARARKSDPEGFRSNANVKVFAAVAKLMLEVIPADPTRPEYRQGNTLGPLYRHWFRANFLGRFRLFFRYDGRARIIAYAWVDDERTLRQAGAGSDPYQVFKRKLAAGNPPNEWSDLIGAAGELPGELLSSLVNIRQGTEDK